MPVHNRNPIEDSFEIRTDIEEEADKQKKKTTEARRREVSVSETLADKTTRTPVTEAVKQREEIAREAGKVVGEEGLEEQAERVFSLQEAIKDNPEELQKSIRELADARGRARQAAALEQEAAVDALIAQTMAAVPAALFGLAAGVDVESGVEAGGGIPAAAAKAQAAKAIAEAEAEVFRKEGESLAQEVGRKADIFNKQQEQQTVTANREIQLDELKFLADRQREVEDQIFKLIQEGRMVEANQLRLEAEKIKTERAKRGDREAREKIRRDQFEDITEDISKAAALSQRLEQAKAAQADFNAMVSGAGIDPEEAGPEQIRERFSGNAQRIDQLIIAQETLKKLPKMRDEFEAMTAAAHGKYSNLTPADQREFLMRQIRAGNDQMLTLMQKPAVSSGFASPEVYEVLAKNASLGRTELQDKFFEALASAQYDADENGQLPAATVAEIKAFMALAQGKGAMSAADILDALEESKLNLESVD